MTRDEALALVETRWWEGMDATEVALRQLNEPRLCMPFGDFHEAVEKAIQRPVWTHEFADPESLIAEIEGDAPPRSMGDILDLLPLPKDKTIVITT